MEDVKNTKFDLNIRVNPQTSGVILSCKSSGIFIDMDEDTYEIVDTWPETRLKIISFFTRFGIPEEAVTVDDIDMIIDSIKSNYKAYMEEKKNK